MKRLSIGGFLVFLLFLCGGIAGAQSSSPSTLYKLDQHSAYEHGCFGQCLCPVFEAGVEGTFVLTPTGSGPLFQTFAVSDLNWTIQQSTGQLLVTGSGTYEIGGEVAAQQRLQLDLQIGNQPVQHFDSGLVISGASFPDISVTISVHAMRCFDTVFVVSASPAPTADTRPYRLISGSSLQSGCLPPCACATGLPEPMSGTFGLLKLAPAGQFAQFAVVDAIWTASPRSGGGATSMHGSGLYQVGNVRMMGKQRLILELASGNGAPTHFDSGLVRAGAIFPLIAAKASTKRSGCGGSAITLRASP